MFIREDLLNKIKEIYEIEEFSYVGIEKSSNYNGTGDPFLLFTTDKNLMAVRKSAIRNDVYNLEIVEKNYKRGYCYLCSIHNYVLKTEGNETVLTKIYSIDTVQYRFPGKAFDFTQEFVIAALESN